MPSLKVIEHAKQFLSKCPMNLQISGCTIKNNTKHGVSLKDWWKGVIKVEATLVSENTETGIIAVNERHPVTELVTEDCTTSRGLIEEDDLLLGKLWLLQGTEISKNDNGLQLQNCYYFI